MTLDMTRGKPVSLIARFALPIILSSALPQLYTMLDSVIVGRMLGDVAFAAVGSASYLDWFPLSMLIGLSQGFGVLMAQRFGARDMAGLRRAVANGALLTLGAAALLTALGVGLMEPFLWMLNTPDELMALTADYLRTLWLGLAVTGLSNLLGSALRAMGDSRTPLLSLVVCTFLNIALDFLFIAHMGMGVTGAALATVLSKCLDIAICLWGVKRSRAAWPAREDFRPQGKTVRELLRLGFPLLLSYGVCATGELYVQAAINLYGVAFITGITAAKRYYTLVNIVGSGIEGAAATFVGQNYGAREPERIKTGMRHAALLALASSMSIAALVFAFSRPLILLFIPTAAADVVDIGVQALRVQVSCLWGLYMLCMYRAGLQGMGNAVAPMLSGFLELALRLAVAFFLPRLMGSAGLYFTDAITWVVTASMLMGCYFGGREKRLRGLQAPSSGEQPGSG